MPVDSSADVSRLELETRILYSLLMPAARLAFRSHIPLDRVTEMVTLAYLSEMREAGLTLKESSSVLGKSLRTVTNIARRLREDFFAPEEVFGLRRKVELQLTAGPATLAELMDAVAPTPRDVLEEAVTGLVNEGRAREVQQGGRTRYEVTAPYVNLVRGTLERRIDGLNHLLGAVYQAVDGRFLDRDDSAFARVLTFSALPDKLAELRQSIYDRLRLATSDLEEEALDAGRADDRFSIVLTVARSGHGGD